MMAQQSVVIDRPVTSPFCTMCRNCV